MGSYVHDDTIEQLAIEEKWGTLGPMCTFFNISFMVNVNLWIPSKKMLIYGVLLTSIINLSKEYINISKKIVFPQQKKYCLFFI